MLKNLESYVNGDKKNGGQLAVIDGLDKNLTEAEDALNYFNQKYNEIINGQTTTQEYDTSIEVDMAKSYYKKMFGLTEKELEKALISDTNFGGQTVYRFDFKDLAKEMEMDPARKDQIIASYNEFYKDLNNSVVYAQAELDSANQEMSLMMMIWAEDEFAYTSNDKALQTLMQTMIGNIDWNSLDIDSFSDAKSWIKDNIFSLINSADEEAKKNAVNVLNQLFTLDFSEMPVEAAREQIQEYLDIIAGIFDQETADKLKLSLGLDVYDTTAANYKKLLADAAQKSSGSEPVRNQLSRESTRNQEYYEIRDRIDEFATQHSINTQDEIAAFQDALEKADYDIDKAFEYYLKQLEDKKEKVTVIPFLEAFTSPDFSEAKQSLLDLSSAGELTAETLSSTEEYKALLDKTGMSAEDLVSSINQFNLDDISGSYNNVLSLLERIRSGEKLTAGEAASLIASHSELADQLIVTSGGYSFEESALISLANSYSKAANLAISNQAEQTKSIMAEIKNRVKAYGIEESALNEMARIYNMTRSEDAVTDYLYQNYDTGISYYIPSLLSAAQEYGEASITLDNLVSQLYEPIDDDNSADALSRITDKYSRLTEVIESNASLINSQISLLETMGSTVGRAYYDELVSQSEQKLSLLTKQHEELRQELANTDKASEKWQELNSSIFEVQSSILQTKTELADLQNTIDELHWNSFDKVTEAINGISEEAGRLIGLLEGDTLLDENNRITDKTLTQLALYAEQMEAAKYLVNKHSEEIGYLNDEYARGTITSEEYAKKLQELTQGQWDCVEAYNSAKKSIIDLRKNAIEEEIDALKELYDLRKEAWEQEKEQYDWEKTKAEKEKSITSLKLQIEELSNDDSLAGIKKRKELEDELNEAQADWSEELYEHGLKEREEALDEELEHHKEELEATLNDEEALLNETLNTVNSNSERVLKTLNDFSREYGININTALTEPFTHGSQALAGYSGLFIQAASAFTAQLDNTCFGIYALQTQADLAAASIVNMFNSANGTLLEQISIVENAIQDLSDELVNIRNEASETANTIFGTISGLSELKLPTINSTMASLAHKSSGTSLPLQGTEMPLTIFAAAGYASGTRSAAPGYHPTFENGSEIIERNGRLLVNYQGGETVFSNEQVSNLWELSRENWIPKLPDYDTLMSRTVNKDVLRNVKFDQNISSLITVEGDMTPDVLKQISQDKSIIEKIKNIAMEGAVEAIYTRGFRK